MKVTVLGFWGGFPFEGKGTTSYLVQSGGYNLLLDAGSTSLIQLEKVIDPMALDSVLITHYHHDHIADLGVLQYLRQLKPSKPANELPIYGHKEDVLHFDGLTLPGVSQGIEYKPNETLALGPFDITFIKTIHPVPCYAVRIVEKSSGKVFVFTADTGYFDGLIKFCQDADLLITDTYFLEGKENNPVHLTSKETGLIAKKSNVKQLVLSHLRQDIDLDELKSQTLEYLDKDIPVSLASVQQQIIV